MKACAKELFAKTDPDQEVISPQQVLSELHMGIDFAKKLFFVSLTSGVFTTMSTS